MPNFVPYPQFLLKQYNGNAINLVGATIKIGILDSTYTPNLATDALWSAVSSGKEVSGTNYTAGGTAIANSAVALDGSNDAVWTFDDVAWAQSGAGFSNGRYFIAYETAGSKLIGYLDNGTDFGNVAGSVTFDVGTSGVIKVT